MIAMANAAANSTRSNLILDPYPSIVDPDNTATLALDPKVTSSFYNIVVAIYLFLSLSLSLSTLFRIRILI